jgi:hypothetical protein
MTANNKLKIARKYQKQIQDLKKQEDKLYRNALRELRIPDSGHALDYFINDDAGSLDAMFEAEGNA